MGASTSIFGDIFYDLGKIQQSLVGYDAVLMNCDNPVNESILEYWRVWLADNYGLGAMAKAKGIAAGLIFSAMPFHDTSRWCQFNEMADKILDEL